MSDNVPGPASTPSHDDSPADRVLPPSSASESNSTPADSTSARSSSAEADALRSASTHDASANPLESGFKTTATPGGVHMSNEAFQELVVRARAGGAMLADDRKDAVFHPSFRVGGSTFLATVKVWFGSPLAVPDDLVRAFNAGNNIPLSLLTVAAIRDYGINQRRSVPPDETQEDDPIFQLTEHALTIISRVNAYTWPVYREYDKRVRQEIWSARHKGIPVPFRINSLHAPTLDDAELMVRGRSGALADYAAMLESGWSAVVTAHPSEVAKFGKRLNEAHAVTAASVKEDPLAHPPQPLGAYSGSRSGATGKRKAADEADASPGRNRSAHQSFQRSVSAPFFPPFQPTPLPDLRGLPFAPSASLSLAATPGIPAPALTRMVSLPARSEKVGYGKASSALRALGGTQVPRNPTSSAISGTTACSAGKTVAGLGIMGPGTAVAMSSPREFPLAPAPVLERLRPTTIRDAFSCVSTTLHAPHFQHAINSMPLSLRSQYAYIPASIRAGFSMGPLQPPVSTILHPNHYKADRQLSVDSWASKSKAAGFIAGPWPVDEVVATVGPIHAAPISIVDKFDQGVLVKERIVYDASYPQPRPGRPSPSVPSINS
ncbi:hypothetical protein CF326_g8194, partial [Tilletia indica]